MIKGTGLVETYLTDKFGVKRKVGEHHNTISNEFLYSLAQILNANDVLTSIEFDNMFTGGTGYIWQQTGHDGIAANIYGFALQAAFASVASQPAANQFRVTGTWTNPTAITTSLANATLGKKWAKRAGWLTAGDGGDWDYPNGGFTLAEGGMVTTAVPAGELITIVWTITFTVH